MAMSDAERKLMDDKMQIRELIDKWVCARDAYDWDTFREVWHPGGIMKATWSESTFEEFVSRNESGKAKGLNILHILGGSLIDVKGNRAISITKMLIMQRANIDGVVCDVQCVARHYDAWEYKDNRWGLVRRETIADKDRIDPVNNWETVKLDQAILDQFPEEYQHLAYLQTKSGYNVDKDAPRVSGGPALDALYERGRKWLSGE